MCRLIEIKPSFIYCNLEMIRTVHNYYAVWNLAFSVRARTTLGACVALVWSWSLAFSAADPFKINGSSRNRSFTPETKIPYPSIQRVLNLSLKTSDSLSFRRKYWDTASALALLPCKDNIRIAPLTLSHFLSAKWNNGESQLWIIFWLFLGFERAFETNIATEPAMTNPSVLPFGLFLYLWDPLTYPSHWIVCVGAWTPLSKA